MAVPSAATDNRQLDLFVCDTEGGVQSVKLGYTYEVWTTRGVELTPQLRTLDLRIEERLTSALEAQYEGGRHGICEVAAQRDDRKDGDVDACTETYIYPVYIRACATDATQCDLVCTPVEGSSMVTYDPDIIDASVADQLVQEALNDIMMNDELLEEYGSVKKVFYVDRSVPESTNVIAAAQAPPGQFVAQPGSELPAGAIVGMVAGVSLVALMSLNAVLTRRRRFNPGHAEAGEIGQDFLDESESELNRDEFVEREQIVFEKKRDAPLATEDGSDGTDSTGEVDRGDPEVPHDAPRSQQAPDTSEIEGGNPEVSHDATPSQQVPAVAAVEYNNGAGEGEDELSGADGTADSVAGANSVATSVFENEVSLRLDACDEKLADFRQMFDAKTSKKQSVEDVVEDTCCGFEVSYVRR